MDPNQNYGSVEAREGSVLQGIAATFAGRHHAVSCKLYATFHEESNLEITAVFETGRLS